MSGRIEPEPEDRLRPREERWVLRLYVAGMTSMAHLALASIRKICGQHLQGRYTLHVIDLHETPAMAESAQIIAVPTLVRESPLPVRKIIGDLSLTEKVMAGLNIEPRN